MSDRPRRRKPPDIGFDQWLDKQLHNLYDPVLNEAVPEEIARLLDQFEPRTAAPDKDKDEKK